MSDIALEPEVTPEVTPDPTAPNDPAPNMVPAERFNGLQRAYQRDLAKLRALEAAQASTPQSTPATPASTDSDPESPVASLLQQLMEDALENWRNAAVAQYPAAAPLREYLTAENKAGVMELAKDLAEKLGGTPSEEAPPVTNTSPSTPAPPPATVTGGSPAIPPSPTDDEELAALREAARRNPSNANYSAYLQKKHAMAGVEYPI